MRASTAIGVRASEAGVLLHITRDDDEYGCLLLFDEDSQSVEFDLPISRGDVASCASRLRQAIQDAAAQALSSTPSERRNAVPNLVFAAKRTFETIFGTRERRHALVPELNPALDRLFSGAFNGLVRIMADFNMPWEALHYDGHPEESGTKGFWGYSHVIQRRSRVPYTRADETQVSDGKLRIGLVKSPVLEGVLEDAYFFEKRDEPNGWIEVVPFKVQEHVSHPEKFKEFTQFLKENHGIKHLICHAIAKPGDPYSMFVQINAGFQIEYADFTHPPEISRNTMIFANMCLGSGVEGTLTKSFAHVFLLGGAEVVITPDIEVGSKFAAEFAKAFYSALLARNPEAPTAGQILRETRRKFLDESPRLLALAYGLHGQADWRITAGGAKRRRRTPSNPLTRR